MQHRPQGAVLAGAGLAALVVVLVATPDAAAWVFGAWIIVLAGVAAVALGIALGFRHQARLDRPDAHERHYLTADWTCGAQVFTVGGGLDAVLEPVEPEPVDVGVDAGGEAEAEESSAA
jgi:hypothetical protein